jgi:hypothetical protein
MGRFDTEWLASHANLETLADLSDAWIDPIHDRKPSPRHHPRNEQLGEPSHGQQEGPAWNARSAAPAITRDSCSISTVISSTARERASTSRAGAAFAEPELYRVPRTSATPSALPANQVLQRRIGHLLTRPVGRPRKQPVVSYASFR